MLSNANVAATPARPGAGPAPARPHVVGIGGTTRTGSTSETTLRFALACAERWGASTELITGALLDLPHYDPSNDHRSPSALRLVQTVARADGVIICTPSYHGALSGMIKNALDYIEDLRDDPRPYLDSRSVGLIVTAHGAQALGTTLVGLRAIVHALRGWPTPFAAALSVADDRFEDGRPVDRGVANQIDMVSRQVVEFAQMRLLHGHRDNADRLRATETA